MRVLVTGANGLLGQKLIELLDGDSSIAAFATGRGVNRNAEGKYTYLDADLTKRDEVDDLVNTSQPTHIIHCSAMTQVDDCEKNPEACNQINIAATGYLIDAAKKVQSHFLYVSTDFVFDGEAGPYLEEATPNPISVYGRSKLRSEELVRNSGLKWAIARTVLVYGVSRDMSRSNIVLWVKKNLEQRKPIKVVTDQWRTPTLVEDLAIGCKAIIEASHEGVFHLSGEEGMSPYQLAGKVADYFGFDSSLISPVDVSTFKEIGRRPLKTGFIIDKAKQILGFQPRSFDEGLALVARQLEESGV